MPFRQRCALLTVLALLGGCASPPAREPGRPASAVTDAGEPAAERAVFTAMQMIGAPYRYGGSTPDGFDCSGLVQYAYDAAGIRLPRTAAQQYSATDSLTLEQARPGDLLFFREGRRISHVALYLGQGRFVHAPNRGRNVSLGSFANSYYRSHFARAGRVRRGVD